MATVSFQQNVIVKDKKMIDQISYDLVNPTFDISKVKPSCSTGLPKDANKIWFNQLKK